MTLVNKSSWIVTALVLFVFLFIPAENAEAQWGIGASYEMRDYEPTSGFGLRIQRDILGGLPILNVGLRAHFSYFSEEIESYRNVGIPAELESYDFGMAALGGINVGLLKPYVGAGLGSESFEFAGVGTEQQNFEDNSLYWNLFVGAELSPIPVLKPFIEYRLTRFFDDDESDYNHNGRLAVGISLVF